MSNGLPPLEILLRLTAALVVGALVGLNRDLEGKPAGMRTLGLVALAGATFTISTLYLDAIAEDAGSMSRVLQGIIQGILTGIGFIGAGVVARRDPGGSVHGITTAATVLVVAGLGVACGVGAWWTLAISASLTFVLLAVMQPLEKRIGQGRKKESKTRGAGGDA